VQLTVHVTNLTPSGDQNAAEAEELIWEAPETDLAERPIIFDADINNVDLRTIHDFLYPEPESGDVVTVTIQSGVIIGSATSAGRAFDVGSWPSGVTINILNLGRIEGAGGAAGAGGGNPVGGPGLSGQVGGVA